MKTLVLSITALLLTYQLTAQSKNSSPYFYEMEHSGLSKPNEIAKANKIKKTLGTAIDKNGSRAVRIEFFDKNGYLISGENFSKKGKKISSFVNKYNNENQLIQIKLIADKTTRITKYEYHSSGKMNKLDVYENDVFQYGITKQYDKENRLIESSSTNKKGLVSKTVYTFDEGKMILSETFNGKGKLIRRFDYSCSQEGEVVALSKVEKKVCSFDAFEDGYLIKIRETLDSKGNMSRVIDKFSASDTSLVETKYQNDNGNTSFLVKFQNNLETERTWYNNKGLEISKWIYMYNETGQKTLVQRWSKGVLSCENRWIYNEFGLCIRTEYSSAKQKNYLVYETEVLERY
jgi:hypothetical protein